MLTVEDRIAQYDWDKDLAYKIMKCESGGNPNALNNTPSTGDYSVGLFQINLYGDNAKSRPSEDWLKVPENNIAYAYELYKKGGFSHWSCRGQVMGQPNKDYHIAEVGKMIEPKLSQEDLIHMYHTLQAVSDSLPSQ